MELNRLTRDADDLIRKVVSRYNQLYVPAGSISQLELDLMLDDLRKLYDTFKNIGQINLSLQSSSPKPEVKVNTAMPTGMYANTSATPDIKENHVNSLPATQAQLHQKEDPEIITETEEDHKPQFKKEPDPEIILTGDTEEEKFVTESEFEPNPVSETKIQTASEISDSKNPVHEFFENSTPHNPEPAPAMLADKFNTGNKSLSETMASSQAQGVTGSRLLFQPIADLTTGIGLNDKFSFISDLFANSSAQYDEAISRINKAVNLDEANWILQKYHSSDWDHKHESLARLKDFVKRRFI